MAGEIQAAFDTVYADGPSSSPDQPDKGRIRGELAPVIQRQMDEVRSLASTALQWKEPVRVASTANIDIATGLENGDTLDGVALAAGDRVLLKDQTAASQNGVYVVSASGAASRSIDANEASELVGLAVFVRSGTANGGKQFACSTPAPIIVGTTSLTFQEISDQSSLNASITDLGDSLTAEAEAREVADNERAVRVPVSPDAAPVAVGETSDDSYMWFDFPRDRLNFVGSPWRDNDDGYGAMRVTGKNGVSPVGVDAAGRLLRPGDIASDIAFTRTIDDGGTQRSVLYIADGYEARRINTSDLDAYGPEVLAPGLVRYTDQVGARKFATYATGRPRAASTAIEHHINHGQSLSNGSSSSAPNHAYTTFPVNPNILMFNGGIRPIVGDQNAAVPPANLTSLVPAVERTDTTTLGETGLVAYAHALNEYYGGEKRVLVSCSGIGGMTYANLKKGTLAWNNMLAQVQAAKTIADGEGVPYSVAVVNWIHGEANRADSPETYRGYLTELRDDLQTDIRAITGQTDGPIVIIRQISSRLLDGSNIPGPERAKVLAGLNDADIYLCGVQYIADFAPDLTHPLPAMHNPLMVQHARTAYAVLGRGQSWKPLYPMFLTRKGRWIAVKYNVPVKPIVIDTRWVSDPGTAGIKYVDDTMSAQVVGVSVSADDEITVELDKAPTGTNGRLCFSTFGAATADWEQGRTIGARMPIHDSDYFACPQTGILVPNYSVALSLTL